MVVLGKKLNMQKTLILMVAINVVQFLGIVAVILYEFIEGRQRLFGGQFYLMPLLLLISLTGTIVAVSLIQPMLAMRIRLQQTEASLSDLNRLNMTLRAQRHDFLNNLQVVYSLIDIGEFEEAKSYIEKEYKNVERVNSVLKTKIPAVNAILQAKHQMCQNRGINVIMDIRSTLSELSIPAWEFCKVLGNIIDNSIHALMENEGERKLTIEIFEDLQFFRFKISNNGPAISPDIREKIFEAGFTTRAGIGEGMGLAICRRIINGSGGSLTVHSDDGMVSFEGKIPRRLPAREKVLNVECDDWSL